MLTMREWVPERGKIARVFLDYSHSRLDLSEKVARIKQAREEAYKEVKQYEDQLKDQLKSAEAGGAVQGDKSSKLAQETEQQLMEIRKSAEVTRNFPHVGVAECLTPCREMSVQTVHHVSAMLIHPR